MEIYDDYDMIANDIDLKGMNLVDQDDYKNDDTFGSRTSISKASLSSNDKPDRYDTGHSILDEIYMPSINLEDSPVRPGRNSGHILSSMLSNASIETPVNVNLRNELGESNWTSNAPPGFKGYDMTPGTRHPYPPVLPPPGLLPPKPSTLDIPPGLFDVQNFEAKSPTASIPPPGFSKLPDTKPPPSTNKNDIFADSIDSPSSLSYSTLTSQAGGSIGSIVSPPPPSAPPRIKCGEMMPYSDIRFVLSRSLQPLEPQDPYSEDFYYIQFGISKTNRLLQESVRNGTPPPPPFVAPLPVWIHTKSRIKQQLEESRRQCGDVSKEWEEKEQVLGHTQRSDFTRPKATLSLTSAKPKAKSAQSTNGPDDGIKNIWALEGDETNYDDEGDDNMPEDQFNAMFSSRLWTMRQAVQRGYEALYTTNELLDTLRAPGVNTNLVARAEVMQEINKSVSLLSQSLGIRVMHTGASSVDTLSEEPSDAEVISLDGALVAALVQTNKGRKLMRRSFMLLPREHRLTLMPLILARILHSDPSTQNDIDIEIEAHLLQTIVAFIRIEHKDFIQMAHQSLAESNPSKILNAVRLLLGHFKHCVKSVMIMHMDKSILRTTLLTRRNRAEVMHCIVQVGDDVCIYAKEDEVALEWIQMKEAFMNMLDSQ